MVFHRCLGKKLSRDIFSDCDHGCSCCSQSEDFSSSTMDSGNHWDSAQRADSPNNYDEYDSQELIELLLPSNNEGLTDLSRQLMDLEPILLSTRACSMVLDSQVNKPCLQNEEKISGQPNDSLSKLPSKRAPSAGLKPQKKQCLTENEENRSGQSIDSLPKLPSKQASSRVSKSQIEQSCPQNEESRNVFKIQNSSENFSNDREVSQDITRTRSKLKNDENPLQNFIKIPKGADVFKFEYLNFEDDTNGSTTRKSTLKYYPKKEIYLKNTFIKYQDMYFSLEKFNSQLEDFSKSKKSKFIEFYNFCMNFKSDKNFLRGISLRPSHDVPKGYVPTEHQSYSNDFYFYVFENMSVRRAFELYIDFIFEESNDELRKIFKFNCCLKTSCLTRCNEKWELLKKQTVKVYIIRPEDREEF